ncbi:site-specific integrase [Shewanella nanhaiensis]|uniref:Site-specific integrase n=1 Tax=Shewanella nanhaiensis TaxID=2864872 RepID=A0ABS7E755_9GAMM|nr:site-specific integrase [Shewanella nanhaiensis]MBW8185512.1 site-specific integrase [Shewanella nanhaiensis]
MRVTYSVQSILEQELTLEQECYISKLWLPQKIQVQTDSDFDTTEVSTTQPMWVFYIGGERVSFNFSDVSSPHLLKLIKYCCTNLISTGRVLRSTEFTTIKECLLSVKLTFIEYQKKLELHSSNDNDRYFFDLKSLTRLLCQLEFPGFSLDNLEDLAFIPIPNHFNPFLKYQDIENSFPSALKSQISHSIVEKSKNVDAISTSELHDIVILGLCYFTGMRQIQLAKLAVNSFSIDTKNDTSELIRYSLEVPYAKQTKITSEKIKIALPMELGLIINEYIKRNSLEPNDRFIQFNTNLSSQINNALQRSLLSIQSNETQSAVAKREHILPRLTVVDFRHNVGHSLAMSGASADEIAYIMGHSSTIAAAHYIMATPELAMIKSKALGNNPVWQNMVNLLITGYTVEQSQWTGKTVSGTLGGELHIRVGGCDRVNEECHLAKVRSCYGCFYFRPFSELRKHRAVLRCVDKELIEIIDISEKSGNSRNPAIATLANIKLEVQMVINRLKGGGVDEESERQPK